MPGPRKRLGVLPVRFRVSELGFREFVCLSVVVKNFTVNSVVLVRVLITPKTAVPRYIFRFRAGRSLRSAALLPAWDMEVDAEGDGGAVNEHQASRLSELARAQLVEWSKLGIAQCFEVGILNAALQHAAVASLSDAELSVVLWRMITSWRMTAALDANGEALAARAESLAATLGDNFPCPAMPPSVDAEATNAGELTELETPDSWRSRLQAPWPIRKALKYEGCYVLARGMLRGRPMFFSNRYFRHAIGKIRRTDDMAALNSNEFLATVVQRTELGKLGQLFGKWYVESAHAKPDSEGWLWSGAPAAFGGSALGQQTPGSIPEGYPVEKHVELEATAPPRLSLNCYDPWSGIFMEHLIDGCFCVDDSGTNSWAVLQMKPAFIDMASTAVHADVMPPQMFSWEQIG